jgi:hypothetical protein
MFKAPVSTVPGNRITVRYALDIYGDVQYIACTKVTLSRNGTLDLNSLSFVKPGDNLVVRSVWYFS